MRSIFFLILFAFSVFHVEAQVSIVSGGRSSSRIVLNGGNRTNFTAANLLQRFICEATGCRLPIVAQGKAQPGDIWLGGTIRKEVSNDGYSLSTVGGILSIAGRGNGTVYGVVSFLERYLNMDYWSDHCYSLPKTLSVKLPLFSLVDNPTFRYRQTQNYAMSTDTVYKWWYRLEEPKEFFAANYWVHTFNRLLPAEEFGRSHPEYFAYYNGKYHPGSASQWCLTNPNVLKIVIHRIDSIFKAHPDMKMICVSQNDGNNTNCKCDNCARIDAEEGAYSGSLIRFINQIAAHFPDKQIATLAYLYTMKPPRLVKPLSNVVVMLCDIDCKREVSLTENASGRDFVQALEGWGKICRQLYVWDYGINFDNYLSPFPNFHILQDNIQLFHKNNVTMHFSQIASSRGGDFAELRSYLVSKLMWNAYADVDSLMQHFLRGYYGKASPYIYRYINIMEGAIVASGKDLWIYDSPVTHKDGMLKPSLMKRYNYLFDAAEKAVATDTLLLRHVQMSRLPLMYSALEIARTQPNMDKVKESERLKLFEQRAMEFRVPTLNERNNPPSEYCRLYRERYLKDISHNLAYGKSVHFLLPPSAKYEKIGATALTDGLLGGTTFVESWIGWEGKDGAFVVDLGEVKSLHRVSCDFLHQLGAWILLPRKVKYSYSEDGKSFSHWQDIDIPELRESKVLFKQISAESSQPVQARYIKVEIEGTKECPSWHYGVGYPSWFFLDEFMAE